MTSLLHLSDLHIGRTPEITRAALGALRAVEDRWTEPAHRPVVLITGDLTQDGTDEQYALAAGGVQALRLAGFTVHCLPGNHDYGRAGNRAHATNFQRFNRHLYPEASVHYPVRWEVPGWVILGLNSMEAETGFFDGLLADGELGRAQLASLDSLVGQLQAARRQQRLKVAVALHHHPFLLPPTGWLESLREKATHWLKDGAALMEVLTGRVDLLLFGHDHEHLDLGESHGGVKLTEQFQIPRILACGSTGGLTRMSAGGAARYGWLIPWEQKAAQSLSF